MRRICGVMLRGQAYDAYDHPWHVCKKKSGHKKNHKCRCGFKFLKMFPRDLP
jgi:hypothetical protein